MNTLPTTIKAQIFSNKANYLALRSHWSAMMNSSQRNSLAAGHHLLYLVLIGRDWRKGFTPHSNRLKLANGAFNNWNLFKALHMLNNQYRVEELLAPFDGLVTSEMVDKARRCLPAEKLSKLAAEDFEDGEYPFDAYEVSVDESSRHSDEVESMQ